MQEEIEKMSDVQIIEKIKSIKWEDGKISQRFNPTRDLEESIKRDKELELLEIELKKRLCKNNLESDKELIEILADIEHKRWSNWQKYLHSKLKDEYIAPNMLVKTMMRGDFEHWERQINTDYKDLSEQEKESDRKEVMQYLPVVKKFYIEEFKKKLLEEINKIWVTSLEGVNNINIKDQQKEFLDKKDIIEVINIFGLSDQKIIAEKQLDEDINIKEKI